MADPASQPFTVLGLSPGASPPEVRAARLALVKALHPDLLGHQLPEIRAAAERRLAEINAAYDVLVARWRLGAAAAAARRPPGPPAAPPAPGFAGSATFTIGAFRPAAFEALIVAAADVGDVTDADEPFSLEIHVDGPPAGFCRLELFPEAGGSVVTAESDAVDPTDAARVLVLAVRRLGLPAELAAT